MLSHGFLEGHSVFGSPRSSDRSKDWLASAATGSASTPVTLKEMGDELRDVGARPRGDATGRPMKNGGCHWSVATK